MRALTETPQIHVNHIVCSDINNDLINTWNSIKEQPNDLYEHYVSLWNELNKDDNKTRKRDYFNEVRARYNKEHNPFDFFFIMRTTTNGMPRYNSKGNFNNSFHITRNGITPLLLKPILLSGVKNSMKEMLSSYAEVMKMCLVQKMISFTWTLLMQKIQRGCISEDLM